MAWYHIPGNEQDIAVSTQVRFMRNLVDLPFPSRMDTARARELLNRVGSVLETNGFTRIDMADISRMIAQSLIEKHYVGPSFVRQSLPHALFLNEPCNLSVMVGDEDHIRIQCMLSGLSLRDAYAGADKIESLLDSHLNIAFDPKWGYLTGNPADLGTAMRISVTLCLPMLSLSHRMDAISASLGQMGFLMRRVYHQELAQFSSLVQISNRITLGMTEENLLTRMEATVKQVIAQERNMRDSAMHSDPHPLTDRVFRAEGILRHAHTLTATELTDLLTQLRMGAALGLTNARIESITSLLVEAMPSTLSVGVDGHPKSDQERNILRARLVKEKLFGA